MFLTRSFLPRPSGMHFCMLLVVALLFCACKKDETPDKVPVVPVVPPKPPVTMVLKGVTTEVNNAIGGYYVATPSNYDSTSERYPLLLFIPGAGQFGNGAVDLPNLLKDGPAQLVDEKRFPGTFTSGGKTYSFIVFTPQTRRYPGIEDLADCLEYVKKNFRVDTTRIYVAGLSAGGVETTNLAAFIPAKIAAISAMGGVFLDYASTNKPSVIAAAGIPVWAFHSENDPLINISDVRAFTTRVNSFSPKIPVRLTVWPNGGHDAWTRALEPTYKENGMNVYEWMLQYQK